MRQILPYSNSANSTLILLATLTATDGMNDLNIITGLKLVDFIGAARHNFLVHFHCDTATGNTHNLNELCCSAGVIYFLWFAINCNIHGARLMRPIHQVNLWNENFSRHLIGLIIRLMGHQNVPYSPP